ncbi:unnamed protein product, partial [Discosporangium mesarthrocarpum]
PSPSSPATSTEEPVAPPKRTLEDLEEELSFEDIMVFRGMAEREALAELQEGGGKRAGNRWGVGGWVSWALGSAKGIPPGVGVTDDDFQRLFLAIDFDPNQAMSNSRRGSPGWVAVTLDFRMTRGSLILINTAAPTPEKRRVDHLAFLEVLFGGLSLACTIKGEDMDGVLARATLDDFGVYEVLDNHKEEGNDSAHQDSQQSDRTAEPPSTTSHSAPPDQPSRSSSESLGQVPRNTRGRTRVISRRTTGAGPGAEAGNRRPLFEMQLESNPLDPDFDAKFMLNVDQVEAVVSPTAGWLEAVMRFAQPPEDLENWSKLETATIKRLNSLRSQLEAKLEKVMSNRLRSFIDLDVRAPLLLIPVDTPLQPAPRAGPRPPRATADPATLPGGPSQSGSGSGSQATGRVGERGQEETARGMAVRELLVVDLGNVRLTTTRLAHSGGMVDEGGTEADPDAA